jgi:uncharacterized phiE125 gp8 family phage protein
MLLRVISQPTQEPISLGEAKRHLRAEEFDDDDLYISSLIMVARDYVEGFQNRSLAPKTYELILDTFPCNRGYKPIRLPRTPVSSVLSVKYTLANGSTTVTHPPASYVVKADGDIVPAYNKLWPSDELTSGDAVKIQYTAGYTEIPAATKQGMLLLIGNWYENREPVVMGKTVEKIPFTVDMLLSLDRMW